VIGGLMVMLCKVQFFGGIALRLEAELVEKPRVLACQEPTSAMASANVVSGEDVADTRHPNPRCWGHARGVGGQQRAEQRLTVPRASP